MILISRELVLSPAYIADPNNPVIGWKNLIGFNSLVADYENASHPVTNMSNSLTNNYWKSTTADDQKIEITLAPTEPIDYIAFAKHNFASGSISVRIEAKTLYGDFEEIFNEQNFETDAPHILHFVEEYYTTIRVYFSSSDEIPQCSVMFCGRLVRMPVGIPVGHTPITDGSVLRSTVGVSEGGDLLGKINLSETLQTSVDFQDIESDWYRTYMRPFISNCKTKPFFFAWSPVDYPGEVGYVMTTNSPRPVYSRETGYMSVNLQIWGIAN